MPEHIAIELDARACALRRGLYQALARAAAMPLHGESLRDGRLRILDVGAGRGELLGVLRDLGHDVVGVDPEAECVEVASRYARCEQAGVDDLMELFGPGAFDVVVCSHVLEHLPRPLDALCGLRLLEARLYVLAVPNVHRIARLLRLLAGSTSPDHPKHIYGWGRPEFEAVVRAAGFEILGWHPDRVTVSPFGGRIGRVLTDVLEPIEVELLPKVFPALASSLIARCGPA